MVEGEMNEVSEQDLLEAMKVAHEAIKTQCKATDGAGRRSRHDREARILPRGERRRPPQGRSRQLATTRLTPSPLRPATRDKHAREDAFDAHPRRTSIEHQYLRRRTGRKGMPSSTVTTTMWRKRPCAVAFWTKASVSTDVRPHEIRPIWCESQLRCPALTVRPSLHVARLSRCLPVTLGTKLDEKIIDDVLEPEQERFLSAL